MGFLGPWFLAGLVGLGLPVYIHLLRKHVTTPLPVSSLMFFERGTQSSTRHRRLRYLLLFALRMALLFLVVLAFANPFIRRASAGANGRLLLIVVDNSFSMRAGTRFADAMTAAKKVLAARPSGQRAQIMVLGDQLQVLTQPIQDGKALQAALASVQQGDSHGNLGELGRGLRAMADTVHTPVELHLFSDMQKTGMPANFADMVLPGNVSVVLHKVGEKATVPNWTVESVQSPAQLEDPKDLKKSRVQAVIAGYSTQAASKTVSLMIGGKLAARKAVNVPANGRATVEFAPLDVAYGDNRCEIRVDGADGFPADDVSVFTVRRSDPEKVLFVHAAGEARSALYFGDALAAAAQSSFVLQPINAEQSTDVDPTKFAFVVLSDTMSLPSIFENSLTQYVRSGGSVLIAAGLGASHQGMIPIWGERAGQAHFYSRDGSFASVAQTDLAHPVLSGDAPGDGAAGWSSLKFFYATGVNAGSARVVARLSDGTPLLLDKQLGEGHVLLLASGLENLTNDLPLHPAFVAFVDRSARYLSGSDRLTGSRVVGSFVQLRAAAVQPKVQGASVEVIDPDGKRPLSLSEAATVQSFELTRAGFYQVRFANGKNALLAVNPDRRESDLESMPEDVLQLWTGTGGTAPAAETAAAAQESKSRVSLWWYVMLVALAAALAESIIGANYLGTQREEA
jgi:hypothetical protein